MLDIVLLPSYSDLWALNGMPANVIARESSQIERNHHTVPHLFAEIKTLGCQKRRRYNFNSTSKPSQVGRMTSCPLGIRRSMYYIHSQSQQNPNITYQSYFILCAASGGLISFSKQQIGEKNLPPFSQVEICFLGKASNFQHWEGPQPAPQQQGYAFSADSQESSLDRVKPNKAARSWRSFDHVDDFTTVKIYTYTVVKVDGASTKKWLSKGPAGSFGG